MGTSPTVGDWAAMNTATPDDETTTAAGDGWSEDMELAPVHPGDRADDGHDDDREGERLQKVLARAGVGSRRVCEDMIEAGPDQRERPAGRACRACGSTRAPTRSPSTASASRSATTASPTR